MQSISNNVTEISVTYKNQLNALERPQIRNSGDAFKCLLSGYDMETIGLQEQFVILYLNRSNAVLGVYRCSMGGITATIADTRLILSVALRIAAVSIMVSHNHPSCSIKPSLADESLTDKLKNAAALLDIKLLDHLIVSGSGEEYFSFADEGLL